MHVLDEVLNISNNADKYALSSLAYNNSECLNVYIHICNGYS